eukprot:527426_1
MSVVQFLIWTIIALFAQASIQQCNLTVLRKQIKDVIRRSRSIVKHEQYYSQNHHYAGMVNSMIYHFDVCLNDITRVHVYIDASLYNQFLNALVICDRWVNQKQLKVIDEFYDKMISHSITPTDRTFNILLKAVRLTNPAMHRPAAKYLEEMNKFGVAVDGYTIVELISMCAKDPSGQSLDSHYTNKQAATSWFERYLNQTRKDNVEHGKNVERQRVVNAYLNVFANDGDVKGLMEVVHLIEEMGIPWGKEFTNTVQKAEAKQYIYSKGNKAS